MAMITESTARENATVSQEELRRYEETLRKQRMHQITRERLTEEGILPADRTLRKTLRQSADRN